MKRSLLPVLLALTALGAPALAQDSTRPAPGPDDGPRVAREHPRAAQRGRERDPRLHERLRGNLGERLERRRERLERREDRLERLERYRERHPAARERADDRTRLRERARELRSS